MHGTMSICVRTYVYARMCTHICVRTYVYAHMYTLLSKANQWESADCCQIPIIDHPHRNRRFLGDVQERLAPYDLE